VSTDRQARDGLSLPDQKRSLKRYAKSHGLKIVAEFSDEGISGSTISDRPGMLALLQTVRSGGTDIVLVTEWERLSRSPHGRDWSVILDACETSGTVLATPQGRLDPRNLEDAFLSGLFGLLAARERAKISRRTMKGKVEAARRGRYLGGKNAPFGYTPRDGKLEINPAEAAVVQKMYDLYLAGASLNGVVRRLREDGHRTRHGKHFSAGGVKRIMSHPANLGTVVFGRSSRGGLQRHTGESEPIVVEGAHEPLVDHLTFERVQARLRERAGRRTKGRGKPRSDYWLTGIVRCSECGERCFGTTNRSKWNGKTLRRYRCSSQMVGGTYHKRIVAEEAEEAFLSRLEELGRDERFLNEGRRRLLLRKMSAGTADARKVHELREAVRKIENREMKAFESYADGVLDESAFKRVQSSLAADRAQAEKELDAAESALLQAASGVDIDKVLSILSRFRVLFLGMEPGQQKELVRALVERVERDGDGGWVVRFRSPFREMLAEDRGIDVAESHSA
jgi:site-specific DNA recombinase